MTVKDIEQAIEKLPREEVVTLSAWFEEFETRIWDGQIAEDSKAGRFDKMIEQAKSEHELGLSKPL